MYVAVEFIGSGTGRKLFEHAVQQVADYGGTEMIMQSDPHARGFYLAIGATEIGTRESGSIPGRFLPLLVLPVNDGNAPGP